MVFKNLFQRKGRTILTLLGISIGVAAIVALGAVARGLKAGFAAMTQGSQADLVLTQAEAFSALMSSIEESVADQVRTWPEVADVDGVLLGNALIDGSSYLFLFGYDPDGFSLGAVGGVCGIFLGFGLGSLIGLTPGMFGAMKPVYTPQLLVQAVMVAAVAGVVGGLYPAWRATRMRPVEALRYE